MKVTVTCSRCRAEYRPPFALRGNNAVLIAGHPCPECGNRFAALVVDLACAPLPSIQIDLRDDVRKVKP